MDETQRSPLSLHVPNPSPEQCDRLRAAVEKAATRSADAMVALREAVCAFTNELRDEGTSPEHVLIALKAVIYTRSFPTIATHPTEWAGGSRLQEKISTWCIEEFFREKTA